MQKYSKTLLKYFLVLAAIFLVVFNWGYVDWFFNYKTIGDNMSYLVRKTAGEDVAILKFSKMPVINQPVAVSSTTPAPSPAQIMPTIVDPAKPSSVYIAKIGVEAPISYTQSSSQNVFASLLKRGVLHYPDSALPGDMGTAIIMGHSAPPNWPKVNYDSIFNDLEKLKPGDEVVINFNGQSIKYLINKTFWVKKGEDLTPYLTFNKSMLLLVSCWPPGHNLQRIVVEAEKSSN